MKAKRLLSAVLFLVAFCSIASAQLRLDILLKDKSIVSCTMDDINYMEIVVGAAPGELDGVWYLGWKVLSNGTGTKTHYNGTEMLVFTAGPKMKWIKSSTETVYDLTYSEAGVREGETFTGIKEGSTVKTTFQIIAMEGDLLLFKQGTNRYYFYNSKEAATNAEFVTYPTRTLYTDADKLCYEKNFDIQHARCYTEYNMKRTGCVGCPFNPRIDDELKVIEKYEPNLYKGAVAVFGKSYEYTKKYHEFRKMMK